MRALPTSPNPPSSTSSVAALVAGTVAVVAALTWLWGWALPLVIFLVLVMVMGHEFGHFITAKRAGMRVSDFFVGFGPVLWSTTRGETRYGIRALPLGGYVKVPGMTWYDQSVAAEDESRTYRSASYPRKVIFASAGSLMHVVMALLLAYGALVFVGQPDVNHFSVGSFTRWDGHAQTAAQQAGLRVGDVFVSVNGHRVTSVAVLESQIGDHAGEAIPLVVRRGSRLVDLTATPVDARTVTINGVPEVKGAKPDGKLGFVIANPTTTASWYAGVPRSFSMVATTLHQAWDGLVHVFTPGEFASLIHQVATPSAAQTSPAATTRPVSIVEVVRLADQAAQSNVPIFFNILITLNIFVGLMNMLPMLPLDGGYVAVATYERLRRRRGQLYRADVNKLTPVVVAFVGVLAVLFACTLYLDIVHPLANPFH